MKKNRISFITINYNSSRHTIELIKSIEEQTKDIVFEIILIDNASNENDLKKLEDFVFDKKNIVLVKNRFNSGFASGNMLGVNYANGEYLFFINNDCKLLNNAGKILKEFLEKNKNVALATATILNSDGAFSSSFTQFPHLIKQLFGNSIQRFFSKKKFPTNRNQRIGQFAVEVVSGSCMFFDSKIFIDIGGFDTIFFLYCEEEDISRRVWSAGKEVYFIPEAEVMHEGGGSSNKRFELEREYYISYYRLMDKYFNLIERCLLKISLGVKLFLRIFKKKNGFKLFCEYLKGFSIKKSLRYVK